MYSNLWTPRYLVGTEKLLSRVKCLIPTTHIQLSMTPGASKYVIHKLLLNRATTENQKQLKYRVIGPSLNGYIHKTLLHLRLRDIAWKLVEILVINFMTFKFSYVLIYIYSFNSVCNVSMCLPVDKSRLWNNRWKNSQLKLYLLSSSLDWDSVSCLWPLGNERQEWHNELSHPLASR